MSTTNIEDIPTQTPVEHLAEVLRREDTSQWEKVDAVKEAVDGEDDAPAAAGASLAGGEPSVNTGLQSAIAGVWEQVEAIVPDAASTTGAAEGRVQAARLTNKKHPRRDGPGA